MLSETADVSGDILAAIGLLLGKPELEAAGAALSAVSGMVDAANDPSVQATVQSALQASGLSDVSAGDGQWSTLSAQLNDFQSQFTDSSVAQPTNDFIYATYDDASLVNQAPGLIDLPTDHHHHHLHHGDVLNSHF